MKEHDCQKCRHFFITFHKGTPYGCKVFNFESAQMPDLIVKNSSGETCQALSPKTRPNAERAHKSEKDSPSTSSPAWVVDIGKARPKS